MRIGLNTKESTRIQLDLLRTPFSTGFTKTQRVCEIRDDFLLCYYIFITRDENISDMRWYFERKSAS